jgi:hypothetical protein
MKEQILDTSFETPAPSAQPHFDDERTLLSARRVVPLEKIDAKERHRRHWLLGGAFAIAMMLGAATALVASYLKLRTVQNQASEITEVETPAAPLAVANPVTSELPAVENASEVENTLENTDADSTIPVTPKKPKRRNAVRHETEFTPPPVVHEMKEDDQLNRIRDAVLFDSWQERRARRVWRRERRNRVDHHDRDLSNLDEIFEGRRKRPSP